VFVSFKSAIRESFTVAGMDVLYTEGIIELENTKIFAYINSSIAI